MFTAVAADDTFGIFNLKWNWNQQNNGNGLCWLIWRQWFFFLCLLRHWLSWLQPTEHIIPYSWTRHEWQDENKKKKLKPSILVHHHNTFRGFAVSCSSTGHDHFWEIQFNVESITAKKRAREPKSNCCFLHSYRLSHSTADDDGVDDGLSMSGVRSWPCSL